MSIIPVQQTLSVTYAKATEANLAIANSPKGGESNSLEQVILPVSLASGKITSTEGNTAVSGIGTDFANDFAVGDYLFYYNQISASPVLLGSVASIDSSTLITLTAGASATINNPGLYAGKANVVLPSSESVLMRVAVVRDQDNIYLPNWNQWLSPNIFGSYNNDVTNNLERYSQVNNPSTPVVPPVNVPYTISPVFGWELNVATQTYFPTANDAPNFAYALINPYGSSTDILAPNTLFKLFASASFSANTIKVGLNYPKSDLQSAGYFN